MKLFTLFSIVFAQNAGSVCDFDPKKRIVDCSNRGFDSASLEFMAERLQITNAVRYFNTLLTIKF